MEGYNNDNDWIPDQIEVTQPESLFSLCIKQAEMNYNKVPPEHWRKLPGELVRFICNLY